MTDPTFPLDAEDFGWFKGDLSDHERWLTAEYAQLVRDRAMAELSEAAAARELDYSKFMYAKVNLSRDSEDQPNADDVLALSRVDSDEMNCIVSFAGDPTRRRHYPMIDLDFSCHLIPSSTEGHFHLVIDGRTLSANHYDLLLNTLVKIGLMQQGNLTRWNQHGMSALRKPGVKKGSEREAVKISTAPWTEDEVRLLERWQAFGRPADARCPFGEQNDPDFLRRLEHESTPLVPTTEGWECPHGCVLPKRHDHRHRWDSELRGCQDSVPTHWMDEDIFPPDALLKNMAKVLDLAALSDSLNGRG